MIAILLFIVGIAVAFYDYVTSVLALQVERENQQFALACVRRT